MINGTDGIPKGLMLARQTPLWENGGGKSSYYPTLQANIRDSIREDGFRKQ
jgi:hypothetical protein